MKKYLLTLLEKKDIIALKDFYSDWDLFLLKDANKNLEAYNKYKYSSIDTICIFAKTFTSKDEFWWILPLELYITKKWIYSINIENWEYLRIEDWSELFFLRVQWIDKETILFFKEYAKIAFNITVHLSYDYKSNMLWTKRFWAYWALISWNNNHFPDFVIPVARNDFDSWKYLSFCSWYFKSSNNRAIIKYDDTMWGKWAYIWDTLDVKDISMLNWLIDSMKKLWKMKLTCMEYIDCRDYEIRLLWSKTKDYVSIIWMYKKERLPGQLLHNISQGNIVWKLKEEEIPKLLIENVNIYCSLLPDKHWWLDIIISKDGDFYFTENNVLTWYLDEEIEYPLLEPWLSIVSDNYKNIS